MSMNSTDFPLVWMTLIQEPDHDHEQDFAEFEANLQRGEPFVLLTDTVPAENHEHSQEEKKRTALWMKKHKVQLRQLVLAMIVIEPNSAKRLGFRAFAPVFAKFWGYPLLVSDSREEAMTTARELLAQNRKSRDR